MYEDLEEARIHAQRAAGIHRADVSIVQEHGGFTLHVDPPAELHVIDVVRYETDAPAAAATT